MFIRILQWLLFSNIENKYLMLLQLAGTITMRLKNGDVFYAVNSRKDKLLGYSLYNDDGDVSYTLGSVDSDDVKEIIGATFKWKDSNYGVSIKYYPIYLLVWLLSKCSGDKQQLVTDRMLTFICNNGAVKSLKPIELFWSPYSYIYGIRYSSGDGVYYNAYGEAIESKVLCMNYVLTSRFSNEKYESIKGRYHYKLSELNIKEIVY